MRKKFLGLAKFTSASGTVCASGQFILACWKHYLNSHSLPFPKSWNSYPYSQILFLAIYHCETKLLLCRSCDHWVYQGFCSSTIKLRRRISKVLFLSGCLAGWYLEASLTLLVGIWRSTKVKSLGPSYIRSISFISRHSTKHAPLLGTQRAH